MTAILAKTKHRYEWMYIHRKGCEITHINSNKEIDRFRSLAKFISDFTDQYNHPPRTKDFMEFAG